MPDTKKVCHIISLESHCFSFSKDWPSWPYFSIYHGTPLKPKLSQLRVVWPLARDSFSKNRCECESALVCYGRVLIEPGTGSHVKWDVRYIFVLPGDPYYKPYYSQIFTFDHASMFSYFLHIRGLHGVLCFSKNTLFVLSGDPYYEPYYSQIFTFDHASMFSEFLYIRGLHGVLCYSKFTLLVLPVDPHDPSAISMTVFTNVHRIYFIFYIRGPHVDLCFSVFIEITTAC